MEEKLHSIGCSLEHFYENKKVMMEKYEDKRKSEVEQNLIYVQDIEAFFTHVCNERNLDLHRCVFRIGMDSGRLIILIFQYMFQKIISPDCDIKSA